MQAWQQFTEHVAIVTIIPDKHMALCPTLTTNWTLNYSTFFCHSLSRASWRLTCIFPSKIPLTWWQTGVAFMICVYTCQHTWVCRHIHEGWAPGLRFTCHIEMGQMLREVTHSAACNLGCPRSAVAVWLWPGRAARGITDTRVVGGKEKEGGAHLF